MSKQPVATALGPSRSPRAQTAATGLPHDSCKANTGISFYSVPCACVIWPHNMAHELCHVFEYAGFMAEHREGHT